MKVHHWYQRHWRQILLPVRTAGVADTSGKRWEHNFIFFYVGMTGAQRWREAVRVSWGNQ